MDDGSNDYSADGAGPELVVLVAVVLVAVTEILVPGVALVAGVLVARPVPVFFERLGRGGEKQGLFLARGQLAALFLGPGNGLVPGEAPGGACQHDQVMRRLSVDEQDAGVDLARGEFGQGDGLRCGCGCIHDFFSLGLDFCFGGFFAAVFAANPAWTSARILVWSSFSRVATPCNSFGLLPAL